MKKSFAFVLLASLIITACSSSNTASVPRGVTSITAGNSSRAELSASQTTRQAALDPFMERLEYHARDVQSSTSSFNEADGKGSVDSQGEFTSRVITAENQYALQSSSRSSTRFSFLGSSSSRYFTSESERTQRSSSSRSTTVFSFQRSSASSTSTSSRFFGSAEERSQRSSSSRADSYLLGSNCPRPPEGFTCGMDTFSLGAMIGGNCPTLVCVAGFDEDDFGIPLSGF